MTTAPIARQTGALAELQRRQIAAKVAEILDGVPIGEALAILDDLEHEILARTAIEGARIAGEIGGDQE